CAPFPPRRAARSGYSEPRVQLDVQPALALPGEVAAHAVLHDARPMLRLCIQLERAVQRRFERLRIEIAEYHAGAGAARAVILLDRVGEAPGTAHDGYRAVAQAVHLVEPARLVTRGHQEQIRRRLDPVRELFVISAVKRHAPGEAARERAQELLVLR